MKKQLFCLLTLLALAILMAAPTGAVAANGAVRTHFTGVENGNYCSPPAPEICALMSGGDTKPLPNGKGITGGVVLVIEFQSQEPRLNGVTVATFDFKPGSDSHTPINGTWHLQPYGIDGYWEGPVNAIFSPTGIRSVYSAKGYGILAGQMLQGTNENGQLSGLIIELP